MAYIPPRVWTFDHENGGEWASINRPTAGAREDRALPVGKHPHQLYSLATPNGQKVTIMFEELLAKGIDEAEYDAHLIRISEGDQFGSGFVAINPNSKVPAMVDQSSDPPVHVFESGSILFYLAEKFGEFLPSGGPQRTEVMNWLFWQMGAAPFVGGGFGHFYRYAPEKFEYPIDRYTMETKRQFDLLDQLLAERHYLAGDDYSIADMAAFPWYGSLIIDNAYDAYEFLSLDEYPNVIRWAREIDDRPAVRRGRRVNRTWGPEELQVPERHSADDIRET